MCHPGCAPMDPQRSLESLLLSLFSADELRRFLRYLHNGDAIVTALPGVTASPATLVHESVRVLAEHGLVETDLWERLVEERPRRRHEIEKVRDLFTHKTPAGGASRKAVAVAPAAVAANADDSPVVLKILLASAIPRDVDRLRVDKEFRRIIDKLRGSRYRDRLRVIQIPALRFEDLRTALMEHEPHVLHLSCHGEPNGSLLFESSAEDGVQVVPKRNLLKLLRALSNSLRLIVFGACHSAALARDVPPTIGLSIGMSDQIRDDSAIEFAVAFYESLAFGKSIQTAFDVALAGLDEEDDIPELFPPAEQDPEKNRAQPLISVSAEPEIRVATRPTPRSWPSAGNDGQNAQPAPSDRDTLDFVVFTALTLESKAMLHYLGTTAERELKSGTLVEIGGLAHEGGYRRVGLVECGPGNPNAGIIVSDTITALQPKAVLFVGIAGGIKDVTLGDVVAATKIYGYESGKESASGFQPRPDVGQSSYRLQQRARVVGRRGGWVGRLAQATMEPHVHVAPIAAGEKVIANRRSEIFKFIRQQYGDAVAVEMEGRGFLAAAYVHNIEAMVIRGISDLVDGKARADSQEWQPRAAMNAAAFAAEVMANVTL